MGSFCRVRVHYVSLEAWLSETKLPVYAASREGESAHQFPFAQDCILILGNESHGISPALRGRVQKTIGIPAYGKAESLNVASAAAVICDNYRRIAG
jgi:TrmH family RNA methyltransferase